MNILRGQRIKLNDLGLFDGIFTIDLSFSTNSKLFGIVAFGLDSEKKLTDDRYMIFYNQQVTPCGGVRYISDNLFEFNLSNIPQHIDRILLTMTMEGEANIGSLGFSNLSIHNHTGQKCSYSFDGSQFEQECSLILFEIYRKEGAWRCCAVGQGFNAGIESLINYFGATAESFNFKKILNGNNELPSETKVSLAKVVLEKKGQKISLKKKNSIGHGQITCNLNWSQFPNTRKKNKHSMNNLSQGVDLDLGCLYELFDGSFSVIQALGNNFGDYYDIPFICLDGDDRTGESSNGEFLFINGDYLSQIKRVCIFAFIYEGVSNWSLVDGIVTLEIPEYPTIEVYLDNHDDSKSMCAIAMLEYDNENLKITKLSEYFTDHEALDKKYGFGLNWYHATKD